MDSDAPAVYTGLLYSPFRRTMSLIPGHPNATANSRRPTRTPVLDPVALLAEPPGAVLMAALGPGSCTALPLLGFRLAAGFPSPAADFQVDRVNLFERLELDKPYVFLARVAGHSMVGLGIHDGDLIVINRRLAPRHGHVVVAMINNQLTCKTLHQINGELRLIAASPDFADIVPREGEEWQVWGVVTSCIKSFPT